MHDVVCAVSKGRNGDQLRGWKKRRELHSFTLQCERKRKKIKKKSPIILLHFTRAFLPSRAATARELATDAGWPPIACAGRYAFKARRLPCLKKKYADCHRASAHGPEPQTCFLQRGVARRAQLSTSFSAHKDLQNITCNMARSTQVMGSVVPVTDILGEGGRAARRAPRAVGHMPGSARRAPQSGQPLRACRTPPRVRTHRTRHLGAGGSALSKRKSREKQADKMMRC